MECKSKGNRKMENIRTELHITNSSQRRPMNFSFQRRSNVYYFSDNSSRGILKRVPVKNGSYRLNELETVMEKSEAAKIRNEIWSDVLLNSPESEKRGINGSDFRNEDSNESESLNKNDVVLKSLDETAGIKLRSQGLENLAILKAYRDYPKTKNEGKKPLKVINRDQNKVSLNKSFRGLKKKEQSNVYLPTDSENLKVCALDENYGKFLATNLSSTSKKRDEMFVNV